MRRASYASRSRRTFGADVSKPGVIGAAQFAGEAVVANGEAPDALRNGANEPSVRRHEAAAEYTHLLFFAADDLAGVDRQAVRGLHRCDPIDDDFVVACRRTHQTRRRAAPGPDG